MLWFRRSRSWIVQIAILCLFAGVAVYFLVLESTAATIALVGAAVALSQGATSTVLFIHRRQLRKVFFAMRDSPDSEVLRGEMIERLRHLPLDEVANVIVGAVRGDAGFRASIEQTLARGRGGIEMRINQALNDAVVGPPAAGA